MAWSPAQQLAQTRPGARGALLFHSCVPAATFGAWPAGVPTQVHAMEDDPWFVGDGEFRIAPVDAGPGSADPQTFTRLHLQCLETAYARIIDEDFGRRIRAEAKSVAAEDRENLAAPATRAVIAWAMLAKPSLEPSVATTWVSGLSLTPKRRASSARASSSDPPASGS